MSGSKLALSTFSSHNKSSPNKPIYNSNRWHYLRSLKSWAVCLTTAYRKVNSQVGRLRRILLQFGCHLVGNDICHLTLMALLYWTALAPFIVVATTAVRAVTTTTTATTISTILLHQTSTTEAAPPINHNISDTFIVYGGTRATNQQATLTNSHLNQTLIVNHSNLLRPFNNTRVTKYYRLINRSHITTILANYIRNSLHSMIQRRDTAHVPEPNTDADDSNYHDEDFDEYDFIHNKSGW